MTLTVIIRTYGSSGVPCACPDDARAAKRRLSRRRPRRRAEEPTAEPEAPRAEAQEHPTTPAPQSGACPDGTRAVGRKRQRRGRRLVAARKLRSNRRRPRHRIPPSEARRLLRLLWINFQRYRLAWTLLHAFRNDYRKKHKKQPRHPKEITQIKPYRKYAFFLHSLARTYLI